MSERPQKCSSAMYDSDEQGFETDLDDDFEGLRVEKTKINKTTTERYLHTCQALSTVPVARFLRQCTTGHVDLKHYGIRDTGAQAVATALEADITVKALYLHDNGISEAGSVALSKMLKGNCFLMKFDLSENKIGKLGAEAIGDMLLENASLRELKLRGCGIHGKDIQRLLAALSVNNHLKSLDFGYNDLGDKGAIHLGSALLTNQTLETLDISWNSIRASGIEELAKGLAQNKRLKELDLSWNRFLDDGTGHLRSALMQNCSLVVLEMRSCGIHTLGAHKIADALKVNEGLEVLRIGKNPFQTTGACSLLRGVRCNKKGVLRELILDDVVFDRECEAELHALLAERPNFTCSWDVSIMGGTVSTVTTKKNPEAVAIFLKFVRTRGLRLLDLFRMVAKDSNATTVTKTEFIVGLKKLNAPLKDHQLRALFAALDVNNDNRLELSEILSSKSIHLKMRHK